MCQEALDLSKERKIISKLTDDKTAVECCRLFLRDHQFLVEPACGATLSAIYSGTITHHVIVTCAGLRAPYAVRTRDLASTPRVSNWNTGQRLNQG